MADNTILKGYWCFDKTIDVGTGIDFSINYTCTINSTKYKGNRIFTNAALGMLYQYDDNGSNNMTLVYAPGTYSNAWNDDDSQTIFVNDEVEQTEGLLSWLQANATKVEFDYNLEEQSVNEYLYVISNLQSKMQNLIISQGGTVKYKSLEQYMQSLIDLRKRFVEILASFNIEASESEKMSPAWADKFNTLIFNLVKGYDLTPTLEFEDATTNILKPIDEEYYFTKSGYGVPRIKKVVFKNIREIRQGAFKGANIEELVLENINVINNTRYTDATYPATAIFTGAVIKKISAPDCTVLGNSLFYENSNIEEVDFQNVTRCYSRVFFGCSNLKIVNLNSLTALTTSSANPSNALFQNCTSLETISLPSLYKIQNGGTSSKQSYMFSGCSALKTAYFDSITSIDSPSYAFQNCTSLETVSMPKCTFIGSYAFNGCKKLANIDNVSIITTIDSNAFANCSLLNYDYWLSLTSLGERGFNNCTSIIRFEAPNLTTIKNYAFANCTGLEEVILKKLDSTSTTAYLFQSCSALKTADLGNITSIGAYCFGGARALTDVYLGYDGVVSLANVSAFGSTTATNPVTLHVRPSYADSYATATNWSSLIAAGKIIIVGDYSD